MSHPNPQIAPCRAMLKELADMAEHASITGVLEDGQQAAVRRFNAVLATLEQAGAVIPGLFAPLRDGASFGEIGVEARLLGSSLDSAAASPAPSAPREGDGEPKVNPSVLIRLAPFMDSDDLGDLIRQTMKANVHLSPEMLVALAPFLDRDDVGDLVRSGLLGGSCAPTPPTPPVPPGPPAPSQSIVPSMEADEESREAVQEPGLERSAELGERIQELAHRLTDPSLTPSERADLAAELARLSHVQAGH